MTGLGPQPFQNQGGDPYPFTQLSIWALGDGEQQISLNALDLVDTDQGGQSQMLPPVERPRERVLHGRVEELTTAELLSLIVGNGDLNLAYRVIEKCLEVSDDFIHQLRHITVEELRSISGIGDARAATIMAVIELGKRLYQRRPQNGTIVDDPAVAMEAFSADLMWETQERFAVLFLDVKHRILSCQVLTVGSATETIAPPREIFGEAVRRRATRIIVAHNHPSGALEPSPEDIDLTRQLLHSGQVLGVPVLDHLILGNGSYVSLRQMTSLWSELPQEGV